MGVAGQGHIAAAVTGAVFGVDGGAAAVACPACGEPAAPAIVPAGALAGVAPAGLGISLRESPE
jgi:hypothetical protein